MAVPFHTETTHMARAFHKRTLLPPCILNVHTAGDVCYYSFVQQYAVVPDFVW